MPRVFGLVLARGGSKGVPRKNIALAGGRPLIAWTIEAALRSSALDRLVVSTDDEEIAAVARQWGAEVPFLRPPELARDETPSIDSIIHAMEWLDRHQDYRPDLVMLLQPTSPLRSAEDITAAVRFLEAREAESVVSVCPAHQHPYWMKRITEDGRLTDFLPLDRVYSRRQDLPPAYYIDGAIYIARREVLLEQRTFFTERTMAFLMAPERTLDVDTPWDFRVADAILRGTPAA